MLRRIAVAGTIIAAVAATAGPTLVSSPVAVQPVPVQIYTRYDQHGVGVGVGLRNQPVVGVSTYDGRACAGFSYQVPFCTDLPTTKLP